MTGTLQQARERPALAGEASICCYHCSWRDDDDDDDDDDDGDDNVMMATMTTT